MAYIGRDVRYGNAKVESFTSSGQTAFTLSLDTTTDGVIATLNGVVQRNGTDFNVTAGTTLTFTSTVVSGVILQVVYMGLSVGIPTPAAGTVGTAALAADAVDGTKIADDAINSEHYAADSIDAEHYAPGSVDTTAVADNAITGAKIAMTSDARGDILYYNGTDYARLAKGSSGTVLKMGANDPAWGTDTAGADLDTANTFTKGQRGEITALSDGSTITPDFNDSNNFSVTLGGNRTLANPSNLTVGQSGSIFVTQDGTGSRTLAYGSYWDFAGGTAPTLTTTASAVDRIDYVVRTTGSIHAVATLALS